MIGAVVEHLWQSTLFAGLAALLTLTLRRNEARVRYWIWLTASLKFLIPFSMLSGLGGHLGWRTSSAAGTARLLVIVQEIGRPLTVPSTLPAPSGAHALPTLDFCLLAIWIMGLSWLLISWGRKARYLRRAVGAALPQHLGREVDALRRVEQIVGLRKPLELRFCGSSLEPGVFGIFRPILLLPHGISECLDEAQLEAIVAHELCHVRNRDNLCGAVHMVIQGVFWFHPLVWWLGGRIVEERERACDEEVLRTGSRPETYAASILSVCRFYLESPLVCVSGVTGADLKKRIECIMTRGAARKLAFPKKLLLGMAAATALAGPIAIGSMHSPTIVPEWDNTGATSLHFREVSIQPGEPGSRRVSIVGLPDGSFRATNAPLPVLVAFAHDVREYQISGGPDWLRSERYDIVAKAPNSATGNDVRKMVRTMLSDRFKLTVRHQPQVLAMFNMFVGTSGPKFQEASRGARIEHHMFRLERGRLAVSGASMSDLAKVLSNQLGRSVVDRTELKGAYDINLDWNGSSLPQAMQAQLGLRLAPRTGPEDTLVIQHVEKPVPEK